ncbi:hypothetical protein QTP88_028287 [Uroleucon formosanum]
MSKNTAIEILNCISTVLKTHDSNELKNKYFSLMADESTNIKNICEMTIIIRFVTDCGKIREFFLCIVELSSTNAQTITETIDRKLKKRGLDYSKLISLGFDGAANFSGSITGVRKRLSEIAHREIPYIHCRTHLLSLALTSARNKYVSIKRTLQVVKDIYKLFHKSAKREKIFHDIQEAINEKKLKIPETIDTRCSRQIVENENKMKSLKEAKQFVDTMIEQMQLRFNEKSLEIIKLSTLFESFESLIKIVEEDILKICLYFPSLEPTNVWIDLNSFKYVANSLIEENVKNPLSYIYKANIGYANLKKLAECLMCVSVSTATAERSFSTMNRIMNKIRNRMGQETLQSCMKINTEGPSELDEDTVNEVIDLYARQKHRRIRLI